MASPSLRGVEVCLGRCSALFLPRAPLWSRRRPRCVDYPSPISANEKAADSFGWRQEWPATAYASGEPPHPPAF
eukprot:scaffold470_cov257-Pinguiococcus_pyrenoidosus.AAC.28